jgi:hypothetical protein
MLSKTSKLGCYSWSLQAWDTCPGAVGADGEAVDACKFCYARSGMYHMPNVKAVRAENKEDWKAIDWVDRMVDSLSNETHFRWFDSGDMYALDLALKIYRVMIKTPHVKHWLPTRMHKFDKFKSVIWDMQRLPNVVVRLSSDSVTGEVLTTHMQSSTIVPYAGYLRPDQAHECPAYKQEGKCLSCRACWDKSVRTVAYPYHGKSKSKVIKIMQVKNS